MKLIHNKKNTWKQINKIVLRVDNIDLVRDDRLSVVFDCGFENISKGRCKFVIHQKTKKVSKELFVHSDKALMEVKINYDSQELEKVLNYLSFKKSSTKKVNITLIISDSLMINDKGDLYVQDKKKINIESVCWNIPIL
ncbi:MAG: hypothetical protein ACJ0G4_05435 [Alphaproteobacteria bacterium]|tara:strand:+ start:764 stop:1180 length:417 start_codon:yes stop_codon:yes gene_type:complete